MLEQPKPGQSLADKFPKVAAQWHPTKNDTLTPSHVKGGCGERVWWRCEQGHEWEAKVHNRIYAGSGCPVCSGRTTVAGVNDLATQFPKVAAQWHPTRNGALTPDKVGCSTRRTVWWHCEEAHEWQARVRNRTYGGTGCLLCSGLRATAKGNDLASRFPDIAAQWHPTRNGDLTPDKVVGSTAQKVWWRCEEGHEWQATVGNRTYGGTGCPVCSGRTTVAGVNDLATQFPEVAAQWHPTRNGDRTPDQVSASNGGKMWWRCEQGHAWTAVVGGRTRKGSGCPVCSGRKLLPGFNDLATKFPKVAAQWHPTRNGDLRLDQMSAGMNTKVWWRCDLGHEWRTAVTERTYKGSGCPVHSGQKLLTGFNDLATRFPVTAAQWHPTRNGDLRPDQVSAGTKAKAWWRCEQGHVWEARVGNRTSGDTGCSVCSRTRRSSGSRP